MRHPLVFAGLGLIATVSLLITSCGSNNDSDTVGAAPSQPAEPPTAAEDSTASASSAATASSPSAATSAPAPASALHFITFSAQPYGTDMHFSGTVDVDEQGCLWVTPAESQDAPGLLALSDRSSINASGVISARNLDEASDSSGSEDTTVEFELGDSIEFGATVFTQGDAALDDFEIRIPDQCSASEETQIIIPLF